MASRLENLPAELFRTILAHLTPEDASSLAQTCHRMNMATMDDKVWQKYYATRYPSILFERKKHEAYHY